MSQGIQPIDIAASLLGGEVQQTDFQFFSLPRAVQDRFVASAGGAGAPRAILFHAKSKLRAVLWTVLGLLALALLICLMAAGYGDIESDLALQNHAVGIGYLALSGLAGTCFFLSVTERSKGGLFPFALGTYVFPVGVVQALGDRIRIFPLNQLSGMKVGDRSIVLEFKDARFTFPVASGAGPQLEQKIKADRDAFERALAQGNRRELAAMDPLRDSGFSNPLSSGEPMAKPNPPHLLRFSLMTLAGLGLGAGLFFARNTLAERSLYKAVRAVDTTAAYQAYLGHGGPRSEVATILLPRTELRDARGSLDKVEAYAAAHPESHIQVEIDAALREELLVALAGVRKEGTLAAIEAFKAAHPTAGRIQQELAAARQAVFAAAIERYVQKASSGLNVQKFFEELVEYSKEHGPRIEIRWRRQIPVSLERADNLLRRSAYFTGNSNLPSQYFSAKYTGPREEAVMKVLLERFQSNFSEEILHFVEGEAVEDGADLPEPQVPTLFISYKTEMSGAYTTQSPRGVFVGLSFMVHTDFHIPGREKPFTLRRFSAWLPPDTGEIYHEKLTPEQVYSRSAEDGFRRYVFKLLTVFVPETITEADEAKKRRRR